MKKITEAMHSSRLRYFEAVEWAGANLPAEHAPFVASAALTLSTQGKDVTPNAVLERLRLQGRDAHSPAAKGWIPGKEQE